MLTLIRGAHIYTPEDLGIGDILFAHGKILCVAKNIDARWVGELGSLNIVPADGLFAIPGLIDSHLHFLGGAGSGGPATRTQEMKAEEILGCGVTSAVGLLGVDLVTRSLPSLYGKALALDNEGVSTWIYGGGFTFPSPTLTGWVRSDLLLIDKVVGVKVAVSERLGSTPSEAELTRLANDVYAGGCLRGMGGILHIHLGLAADPYGLIQSVLEHSGVPPETFLLCHINYSAALFEGAQRFSVHQTYLAVDSTLDPALEREGTIAPARAVVKLLEAGASPTRLILQSDANGYRTASLSSLLATVGILIRQEGFPLAKALPLVTTNPARILGLSGRKGSLEPGADADIVLLGEGFRTRYVFARGIQRIPAERGPDGVID